MPKSTHFIGQPLYAQILQLINKNEVLRISKSLGGERYVKRFDAWNHLTVMLYAVIKRTPSIRVTFPRTAEATVAGILLG